MNTGKNTAETAMNGTPPVRSMPYCLTNGVPFPIRPGRIDVISLCGALLRYARAAPRALHLAVPSSSGASL